jgi:hypothetical protein
MQMWVAAASVSFTIGFAVRGKLSSLAVVPENSIG